MYITFCPICDHIIASVDELELYSLDFCDKCGFNFRDNRCSNPECRKQLHYSKKFCPLCGSESNFYLDAYDIRPDYIEDDESQAYI